MHFKGIIQIVVGTTMALATCSCMKESNDELHNLSNQIGQYSNDVHSIAQDLKSMDQEVKDFKELTSEIAKNAMTSDQDDLSQATSGYPNTLEVNFNKNTEVLTAVAPQERCVSAPITRVHESITDFASYKNIDDRIRYQVISNIGLKLIRMEDVRADTRQSGPGIDSRVDFIFAPQFMRDKTLKAYFKLHCISQWRGGNWFAFNCRQIAGTPHFGVDDFHFYLTADQAAKGCTGTKLQYTLKLVSGDADVAKIEKGCLLPDAENLFNPNKFFTKYYIAFYSNWMNTLH